MKVRGRHGALGLVLILSVAVHGLAALVFGGVVLFRHAFEPEVLFAVPVEPLSPLEPTVLEHEVRIETYEDFRGEPPLDPRLTEFGEITPLEMPDLSLSPTPLEDMPGLESLMGAYREEALRLEKGQGLGRDGESALGVTSVNFFGMRGQAERVLLVLESSPDIAKAAREAPQAMAALQREVSRFIEGLEPGSSFNVIAAGSQLSAFDPEMRIATPESKASAKDFILPHFFGPGTPRGNLEPQQDALPGSEQARGLRLDLAVLAAYELRADLVVFIADGNPQIPKGQNRREFWTVPEIMEALERAWREDYGGRLANRPRFLCLGFRTLGEDSGQEDFLRALALTHRGEFRRIRR